MCYCFCWLSTSRARTTVTTQKYSLTNSGCWLLPTNQFLPSQLLTSKPNLCNTWNRQVSFLLWAPSDTLPTEVNLRQWCIQSDVWCTVTLKFWIQILGGCPVALTSIACIIHIGSNLHFLATRLVDILMHPCVCWSRSSSNCTIKPSNHFL